MKRKIFLIILLFNILILIFLLGFKIYNNYKIKHAKINVILNDNLTVKIYEKVKISLFIKKINGKILKDKYINTNKIGKKKIKFTFINNDNIKVKYSFSINIIDDIPPIINTLNNYNVKVGNDFDSNKILCGDNYDNKPDCNIVGNYDINIPGVYPLEYIAKDSSNNITQKNFTLSVLDNIKTNNTLNKSVTLFTDIVKNYKTEKNSIGIDVSKYQGNIDFKKVKKAGVSFVMIKLGGKDLKTNQYYLDDYFQKNIENAISNNLKVGVYFYSYAKNEKESKKDALWVIKNIKKYKIDLPVAYDFEDFNNFNNYHLSFYNLTKVAYAFLDTIKKYNYDTLLYGSKNYLENYWMNDKHDVWLAHYTNKTNYNGKYKMWQLCENGIVDGIDNKVDIDILYD